MAHGIIRARSTIGSYRTAGDALVLVIDRSERHSSDLHAAIVSAHCGGHGCTAEPRIEQGSHKFLSMIDPAAVVAECARPVQEWAQAHAETCRATPAPDAHPAQTDLPLCGIADPDDPSHTCQLTAGHPWYARHIAYPPGNFTMRHEWDAKPAAA